MGEVSRTTARDDFVENRYGCRKPIGSCRDGFIRVWVLIDSSRPLQRGVNNQLRSSRSRKWEAIRYDKVSQVCFLFVE